MRDIIPPLCLVGMSVSTKAELADTLTKRGSGDLCEVTAESRKLFASCSMTVVLTLYQVAIVGGRMFISGGSFSFQDGDTLARGLFVASL